MIDGYKACSNKDCNKLLSLKDFYLKSKNPIIYGSECKKCKNKSDLKRRLDKRSCPPRKVTKYPKNLSKKEKDRLYYLNNKEKIDQYQSEFRDTNREKLKVYAKQYRQKNSDKSKESSRKSKIKHKDKVAARKLAYQQHKAKIDPIWKMRRTISRDISKKINKNSKSFISSLGYSLDDLKRHLESLFEPWMNWGNRGIYNPTTWNDNDQSTWTWNIDHIIPHSEFNYTSLEDEDFKKCWSLQNLRPYSAKQNILDGSNKIRHKKRKNT
jgi:hypothetical protein